MEYDNIDTVIQSLRKIPKPWGKNINTACALVLLSSYVNTKNRDAYNAIMQHRYSEALDVNTSSIDPTAPIILGLVILERMYPKDTFAIEYGFNMNAEMNNPGRLPQFILTHVTKGISYIVGSSSVEEGVDIEGGGPEIMEMTYGDNVLDMDDFQRIRPNIPYPTVEQLFAPGSDFVSMLGNDQDAIELVYEIKRARALEFLSPMVDKQLQ